MRCEDGHGEGWDVTTDEYNNLKVSLGDWAVHLDDQDVIDAIIDALRSVVKDILRSMGV